MRYLRIILGISIIFFQLPLSAQERQELETQKEKLKREINRTNKFIKKTDKKINATLDNYELIEQKIVKRKDLLNNIENEISLTEEIIAKTDKGVDSIKVQIEKLQAAHYALLNKSYINTLTQNNLLNFLSAESFEDAFKRWLYSRQYNAFIQEKRDRLNEEVAALNEALAKQHLIKLEKENLKTDQQSQTKQLNAELVEKDKLIIQLEKEQAQLKIELLAKKKKKRIIDETIKRLIEEEINKVNSKTADSESTIDESNFSLNKGKLDWPVKGAVVIGKYGKQRHPTNKALEIENNGLDFKTNTNASVNALYSGKVVGLTTIPGIWKMLIIKHGKYYSVYSKLIEVYVDKEDRVKTGQSIGKVKDEFHLEIWNGKVKQNPSNWLKK